MPSRSRFPPRCASRGHQSSTYGCTSRAGPDRRTGRRPPTAIAARGSTAPTATTSPRSTRQRRRRAGPGRRRRALPPGEAVADGRVETVGRPRRPDHDEQVAVRIGPHGCADRSGPIAGRAVRWSSPRWWLPRTHQRAVPSPPLQLRSAGSTDAGRSLSSTAGAATSRTPIGCAGEPTGMGRGRAAPGDEDPERRGHSSLATTRSAAHSGPEVASQPTSQDRTAHRLRRGGRAKLETDETGWSVLVHALAERVTDGHGVELMERTRATGVTPWAPGKRSHWYRLIPQAISGRRIAADRAKRR